MVELQKDCFLLLEVEHLDSRNYFARCCFKFGQIIIGDFEQRMVVGALSLSLKNTLFRLDRTKLISCKNHDLNHCFFNLMKEEDDILQNSIIPLNIEAFDGDVGIFMRVDDKECLIVKIWPNETVTIIDIDRKLYQLEIKKAYDRLNQLHTRS